MEDLPLEKHWSRDLNKERLGHSKMHGESMPGKEREEYVQTPCARNEVRIPGANWGVEQEQAEGRDGR